MYERLSHKIKYFFRVMSVPASGRALRATSLACVPLVRLSPWSSAVGPLGRLSAIRCPLRRVLVCGSCTGALRIHAHRPACTHAARHRTWPLPPPAPPASPQPMRATRLPPHRSVLLESRFSIALLNNRPRSGQPSRQETGKTARTAAAAATCAQRRQAHNGTG